MKNNKKFLFCEFCGFKKIIDDLTNLCVIKNINIQGKIEKSTKIGKEIYEKNKMYKCPKCGRGVIEKKINGAYLETIKKNQEEIDKKKIEEDRKKRLEDGKPIDKRSEFYE